LNQKYFTHDFTLFTKTGATKIHRDKSDGKSIDNFKITFVDTGVETLAGERILRVRDYIPENEDFMLTYGDGVGDINIKELVLFHRSRKTIGTVTGVHPRSKYGMIRVRRNKAIFDFHEKPQLNDWVNGGFMVFKRDFFDYIKPGEMEHPALRRLVAKGELSLYMHHGFWHSMDTYTDVDHLSRLWRENPKWKLWKD